MIDISRLVLSILVISPSGFAKPKAPSPLGPGTSDTFSPNLNDFDQYGIKFAVNDYFSVEVQPNRHLLIIEFSPYTYPTTSTRTCNVNFQNQDLYIYGVAVGQDEKIGQFAYIGEDSHGNVQVGFATYSGSQCNFNWNNQVKTLETNSHEEFFVLDVDDTGTISYVFSQSFNYQYNCSGVLSPPLNNQTTIDNSFMPHAIDTIADLAVLAGFTNNTSSSLQLFIPIVYLVQLSTWTILTSWQYQPPSGSWQAELTNSGADVWSARFDMSVSISGTGLVLVGIPSVNSVFLFQIINTTNSSTLNLIGNLTSEQATVGFGKAVTWLNPSLGTQIAILNNVYTLLDYQWISSSIEVYSISVTPFFSSTQLFDWPNSQQKLSSTFNPSLLNIVSTVNSTLAVLDILGNVYLILPSKAGNFSQTNVGAGANPSFSVSTVCLPGMFKNVTSIGPCSLCPSSTKNPGGNSSDICQPCLNTSFCPLGSTGDVPYSVLDVISQALVYPTSPESIAFDDILLQNMFTINVNSRCLLVSPAFWALISMFISLILLILIGLLQFFPRMHKLRSLIQRFFKHTDLVREGELWTGGLASLAILVFVAFAAFFSHSFVQQYPIENVGDSSFACDTTLRNAKFQTNIQSLGTPPSQEEQTIFDMMNNQSMTLTVDFLQTVFTCSSVSVYNTRLTVPTSISFTCPKQSMNNILSISIQLSSLNNDLKILLNGILPVGAIRLGMNAPEQRNDQYFLRELHFVQPFYSRDGILAPESTISMQMTKVINRTESLDTSTSPEYSALFIPTFLINLDQTFVSESDYNLIPSFSQLSLSISISETTYYINNNQSPIAKSSEIIFQNILFALVCVEIFGFLFLLCKLLFLPLLTLPFRRCLSNKDQPTQINQLQESHIVSPLHHSNLNPFQQIFHHQTNPSTLPIRRDEGKTEDHVQSAIRPHDIYPPS